MGEPSEAVRNARVDRSFYKVTTLEDQGQDGRYWRTRTPAERMSALELMRQIAYGYDPATTRLQRVFGTFECPRR